MARPGMHNSRVTPTVRGRRPSVSGKGRLTPYAKRLHELVQHGSCRAEIVERMSRGCSLALPLMILLPRPLRCLQYGRSAPPGMTSIAA